MALIHENTVFSGMKRSSYIFIIPDSLVYLCTKIHPETFNNFCMQEEQTSIHFFLHDVSKKIKLSQSISYDVLIKFIFSMNFVKK